MVIEYQIKRFDLVKAYFFNLRNSPRTRLIVIGAAFLFFAYHLFLRYRFQGNLNLNDFVVAIMFAVGIILAIPVLSFITAKTQKRVLSINEEGIETKIGKKKGKILWKAVDSISTTPDRVIITGKNANAFTIPENAFKDSEHRQQFIALVQQNLANSKK